MALRALDKDELIRVLEDLGYKELATSTKRWDCGVVAEESSSLFRMALDTRISNTKLSFEKYNEYAEYAEKGGTAGVSAAGYKKACDILNKMIHDMSLGTKEYQERIFAKEHNIYNSHSMLELPLDKKPGLNALYDDFAAIFLFFDDISAIPNNMATVLSKLEDKRLVRYILDIQNVDSKLKSDILECETPAERAQLWERARGEDILSTFERIINVDEKIKFVKDHIKFDHLNLGGVRNPNWAIFIYGQSEPSVSKLGSNEQQAIAAEDGYYDFNNLTLADTLKIKNRDLMQLLQARIDIDRENLEILDEKDIGGDNYRLVRIREEMRQGRSDINPLLIRFICPSTGRVYHVECDENSLRNSKYFAKGEYDTYLEAWWHISHGGMDPRKCSQVIRT